MINEYKHKGITWLDLENPTPDEAREIVEKYNVDPLVADELLTPSLRPKVECTKDYIYLILHFPVSHNINSETNPNDNIQEVDFIVGKKFIITTRYSAVDALLQFSRVFAVQSILDKSNMAEHGGYLFYYMTQHLYRSMANRLANIKDLMRDIESKIFSGQEKHMVIEISKINRLLLNYQQSTDMHKEILESFNVAGLKFFGEDFDYYLHGVIGEYYKVRSEMSAAKDYLNELRSTNDSLLSTNQNEIMKVLTVTNFIVLPLSLVAGLFGMNTETTPLIGHDFDFAIVVAIMLLLAGSMFFFFRWKKWL